MTTINDVCRHVRSKNAGPFWITFDLFFEGEENFKNYSTSPSLNGELFKKLFGADPLTVKHFPVPSLNMVKISYGRSSPQGGEIERDMHAGQQFVRLLDVEIEKVES
ncbi:MAG: hypothetical protein COB45_03020 [Gammaproteobacteria bacterium]|nr:MAG: hypothetical protein COB45_03020 [Gammaproteobacteria bacterium]PHR83837.1 MAG: hypothetical protein COA59_09290 [Colwellia sp.]